MKTPGCAKCDDEGQRPDGEYCACLNERTKRVYEQIDPTSERSSRRVPRERRSSRGSSSSRSTTTFSAPCPTYEVIGPGADWRVSATSSGESKFRAEVYDE